MDLSSSEQPEFGNPELHSIFLILLFFFGGNVCHTEQSKYKKKCLLITQMTSRPSDFFLFVLFNFYFLQIDHEMYFVEADKK